MSTQSEVFDAEIPANRYVGASVSVTTRNRPLWWSITELRVLKPGISDCQLALGLLRSKKSKLLPSVPVEELRMRYFLSSVA